MIGDALGFLWALAGAYLSILLFCLFCGLVGLALVPLYLMVERLEERLGGEEEL